MFFERSRFWTCCLLTLSWVLLCAHLGRLWSANSQYSFGWVVPALSGYMTWLRWQWRPLAGRSIAGALAIPTVAVLAFTPTWLILQPSPDWRLANWMLTGEVVAITLGVTAWAGGKSWIRHFVFPVCFIFVAVPWPRPLEIPLTDFLMRGVAILTAELLNATGTLCVANGNVLEITAGRLGVEEACSGIRSLQAAVMLALAFGELFSLTKVRRCFLVMWSVGIAGITNLGRTYFLGWACSRWGMEAQERWHDWGGFFAMSVCLSAVWWMARVHYQERPIGDLFRSAALPLPASWGATLCFWFVSSIAGTEIWFYDPAGLPQPRWSIAAPPDARPLAIGQAVADDLQYDHALAANWRSTDGAEWMLYYFEWQAGPMRSRILARLHQPDRCLPATGLQLVADRGQIGIASPAGMLHFHAYIFMAETRPMYVYTGLWQVRSPRAEARGPLASSILGASLQSVKWRERALGQQIVEMAAVGYPNSAESDGALAEIFPRLLQVP